MKPFELLLAYRVVEYIHQQSRSDRKALEQALDSLRESPHSCANLSERHSSGRDHFVFLRGKFAMKYWIDEWECEVKVLQIQLRDHH